MVSTRFTVKFINIVSKSKNQASFADTPGGVPGARRPRTAFMLIRGRVFCRLLPSAGFFANNEAHIGLRLPMNLPSGLNTSTSG